MINRYFIHQLPEISLDNTEVFKPNYNAQAGHILPIISMQSPQGLSYFYWGSHPDRIKGKSVSAKLINLEMVDLKLKPVMQKSLLKNRCLVPINGFYAWKNIAKKRSIPYCVKPTSEQTLLVPGIWEEYENEEGQQIHTFSILTKAAPPNLLALTKEVPCTVKEEDKAVFLNESANFADLIELIDQLQEAYKFYTISPKVNRLDYNQADLLQSAPAADQFGNYALFD